MQFAGEVDEVTQSSSVMACDAGVTPPADLGASSLATDGTISTTVNAL
jgi:hypothetical protein